MTRIKTAEAKNDSVASVVLIEDILLPFRLSEGAGERMKDFSVWFLSPSR